MSGAKRRRRATSAVPPPRLPSSAPLIEPQNLPVAKKPRYANGHVATTANPVPYGNHAHLKKAKDFHATGDTTSAAIQTRTVFRGLTKPEWNEVTAQFRMPGEELRLYQMKAGNSLLEGSDTVVIAATGMGKSWMFSMMALADPANIVLVVVPLKSLGKELARR